MHRIDDWISPTSNPKEIVQFALSDMVMEKADVKYNPNTFLTSYIL